MKISFSPLSSISKNLSYCLAQAEACCLLPASLSFLPRPASQPASQTLIYRCQHLGSPGSSVAQLMLLPAQPLLLRANLRVTFRKARVCHEEGTALINPRWLQARCGLSIRIVAIISGARELVYKANYLDSFGITFESKQIQADKQPTNQTLLTFQQKQTQTKQIKNVQGTISYLRRLGRRCRRFSPILWLQLVWLPRIRLW